MSWNHIRLVYKTEYLLVSSICTGHLFVYAVLLVWNYYWVASSNTQAEKALSRFRGLSTTVKAHRQVFWSFQEPGQSLIVSYQTPKILGGLFNNVIVSEQKTLKIFS